MSATLPPTAPVSPPNPNLDLLCAIGLFMAVNALAMAFQQPITWNDGWGFDDGIFYQQVADQFAHGRPIVGQAPFVYRIGTPVLAAVLAPGNLMLGFKLCNVLANLAATVLMVIWLRRHVPSPALRVGLVALFLTHWLGPVRSVWFYPAISDPWLFAFLFGGLILIDRYRASGSRRDLLLLAALSFVGSAFREVVLVVALALPFAHGPLLPWRGVPAFLRQLRPLTFLPLAAGLLGLLLVRRYVAQENDYAFAATALGWLYAKPPATLLLGVFNAFGPLLFLIVWNWRGAWRHLTMNQHLLVYLAAMVMLAWMGGMDNERLMYWCMPVVYLLLARAVVDLGPTLRSAGLLALLLAGQSLAHRLWWTTPDFVRDDTTSSWLLLAPLGAHVRYLDLLSFHMGHPRCLLTLAQYALFGLVVLEWLRHRASRPVVAP